MTKGCFFFIVSISILLLSGFPIYVLDPLPAIGGDSLNFLNTSVRIMPLAHASSGEGDDEYCYDDDEDGYCDDEPDTCIDNDENDVCDVDEEDEESSVDEEDEESSVDEVDEEAETPLPRDVNSQWTSVCNTVQQALYNSCE
jgi:hypothetical protein